MDRSRIIGLALAAGSGILYGSINVLSKPIDLHPLAKTAIVYLTSAAVLAPFALGLRVQRRDWPKVLVMGLVGGGVAPILLFFGLRGTAATDAGLLLTLELVVTAALAMMFLHERFRGNDVAGLLFLLSAAGLVALSTRNSGDLGTSWRGVLLVLGSAVGWGIDNAVSTRLVGSYRPAGLIAVKGLLGGLASLGAFFVVRAPTPSAGGALAMAALGVTSIALSSMFFYNALARIGAARTSAMNIATTALIGAVGGAALLDERLGWLHVAALAAVGAGAFLLGRHAKPS